MIRSWRHQSSSPAGPGIAAMRGIYTWASSYGRTARFGDCASLANIG